MARELDVINNLSKNKARAMVAQLTLNAPINSTTNPDVPSSNTPGEVLDKEKTIAEAKRKQRIVLAITIVSVVLIIGASIWFTRKKK